MCNLHPVLLSSHLVLYMSFARVSCQYLVLQNYSSRARNNVGVTSFTATSMSTTLLKIPFLSWFYVDPENLVVEAAWQQNASLACWSMNSCAFIGRV